MPEYTGAGKNGVRVTPYTAAQRRLFHAAESSPEVAEERGISHREAGKLAREADKLAREGREKRAATKKAIETAVALIGNYYWATN